MTEKTKTLTFKIDPSIGLPRIWIIWEVKTGTSEQCIRAICSNEKSKRIRSEAVRREIKWQQKPTRVHIEPTHLDHLYGSSISYPLHNGSRVSLARDNFLHHQKALAKNDEETATLLEQLIKELTKDMECRCCRCKKGMSWFDYERSKLDYDMGEGICESCVKTVGRKKIKTKAKIK